MRRFIANVTFILSISICSNLFIAGCNLLPISEQKDNSTSNSSVANSIDSSPRRNAYAEIDLDQFSADSKKGNSPKELALNSFGAEEIEGSLKEEVEVDTSASEQSIVTITQMNLPDDSVKSIRYRIDFKSAESQWQMQWAGQQFICQPGRGIQDWSKELCY
ncbi:MAG: hypothetical protein AAFY50_06365 [Cyanobacteria bacterium J06648_1]